MSTSATSPVNVDPALVEMMAAVFTEYRDTHPPTKTVERDAELWRQLDELGLVRLTGAEESGGSGAGWFEAAELLAAAARNAVRIPLAEHDLLACWLLDANTMPVDAATRTICLLDDDRTARGVPWAASSDRAVVLWRDGNTHRVADVDTAELKISPGANLIGEPRDTVVADVDTLDGVPVNADLLERLRLKAALTRAIQVCAVLDEIVLSSINHAGSRIQFGRALSRFQAVQHLIADVAAEAALARAATEAALMTAVASGWTAPNLRFRVATARSCVGHASSVVVRNAHQIHGAIGTTYEHRLHEFTRAALAWRSEFGSVRYWDEQVSAATTAPGADMWGLITD